MIASDSTITGNESATGDDALDTLIGFYRAFNACDLSALEHNWMEGDVPSMNNPIGGIRRGWPSIREGYQRLFDGPADVRVEFFDFVRHGNEDWQMFAGRERGYCVTPIVRVPLRIRTTRWFVRQDGRWRQLHHHGSIEEPALLADYQLAIFGKTIEGIG